MSDRRDGASGAPAEPLSAVDREAAVRRLEDRYALSPGGLRVLVPVPPVTSRAGRLIRLAAFKRALLAVPAIRRAVGARARRRASREAARPS